MRSAGCASSSVSSSRHRRVVGAVGHGRRVEDVVAVLRASISSTARPTGRARPRRPARPAAGRRRGPRRLRWWAGRGRAGIARHVRDASASAGRLPDAPAAHADAWRRRPVPQRASAAGRHVAEGPADRAGASQGGRSRPARLSRGRTAARPSRTGSDGSVEVRREARSVTAWTTPVTSGRGSPTGDDAEPTRSPPRRTSASYSSSADGEQVEVETQRGGAGPREQPIGARRRRSSGPPGRRRRPRAGRRRDAVPAGPSPASSACAARRSRWRSARRRRAPRQRGLVELDARLPRRAAGERTAADVLRQPLGQEPARSRHAPGRQQPLAVGSSRRPPASTARRPGA